MERFLRAPTEQSELRRVARALGNEMPRHRIDLLRQFRAEMARVPLDVADYAAGYVTGMLDVTAEYETTVQQAQSDVSTRRMALREGWRQVLLELSSGPRLPSEIATRVGKDRSSITRILHRLRISGLVQATSDDRDGRARPHRLTAKGLSVVREMKPAISSEVEQGITIATHLLQYLLEHHRTRASDLEALAESVLGDSTAASAAVRKWVSEAQNAGILSPEPSGTTGSESYQAADLGVAALDARSVLLWQSVPQLLDQHRQYKEEPIPIFVRTGEEGWAAWAHGLRAHDSTGMSRTIVNGDLVSGAVRPPDEKFDLLYDDPAAIRADQNEPTMLKFMERADAKFVIAGGEADIPDGFIGLTLEGDGAEAQ